MIKKNRITSFSLWVTAVLQVTEIAKTLAEFLIITQIRTCLKQEV